MITFKKMKEALDDFNYDMIEIKIYAHLLALPIIISAIYLLVSFRRF